MPEPSNQQRNAHSSMPHIANAMFKTTHGGAEQAFIDYCRLCLDLGYRVTALIHPRCQQIKQLQKLGIPMLAVSNIGGWDFLARWRWQRALKSVDIDLIICHGARPADLLYGTKNMPIIGVAHVYGIIKRLTKLDGIIALTQHMMTYIHERFPRVSSIYHVPNTIYLDKGTHYTVTAAKEPLTIGAMGRLTHVKGFDTLLYALAFLKAQHIPFRCLIAGKGKKELALKQLTKKLDLTHQVHFLGWIEAPGIFYESIDIFCLPSRYEPFGLTLLEAMAQKKPIVSTDAEGPSDILIHKKNALIVPRDNPNAMGEALLQVLQQPSLRHALSVEAFGTFEQYYTPEKVALKLKAVIDSNL